MSGPVRLPKHLRLAFEAARAVLGDAVTWEHKVGARHQWRMKYGSRVYPMCGSPMNKEDEVRYARQWAQRMKRGLDR